ncbi:MAG: VOC family protein [Chloroflexota bacterium]
MSASMGVDHEALTVSDLGGSAEWYQEVFGLVKIADVEEGDGERRKVILRHSETGLRIGLVAHRMSPSEPFDETRVGLDHLSIEVASRAELDAMQQRLQQLGAHQSPIAEALAGASVIVFRDSDNVQLELVFRPTA